MPNPQSERIRKLDLFTNPMYHHANMKSTEVQRCNHSCGTGRRLDQLPSGARGNLPEREQVEWAVSHRRLDGEQCAVALGGVDGGGCASRAMAH